jgi:putative ABC transport system ATP-binding protein
MKEINRTMGTTFIFSTHDKKVIEFADHYVGIEDGQVRFLGLRKDGRWVVKDEWRHLDRRQGERRQVDRRQAVQANTGEAPATKDARQ